MASRQSIPFPTMRRKPSVESYAHKAAKRVVVEWLRAEAARVGEDNYTGGRVLGVDWRVNRGAPHYGVWEEYPVLPNGCGVLPVWDEEWSDLGEPPPTYADLRAAGRPPAIIFDVAVQHKGQISCAIEIVHKNPLTEQKLRFIAGLDCNPWLLVLPARWVLGQIGVPLKRTPEEFWPLGSPYAMYAKTYPASWPAETT